MPVSPISFRQKLLCGLLLLACIGSASLYTSRTNQYATMPTSDTSLTVTNPLVLNNWLPSSSVKYTLGRLGDYVSANNIDATSVTVTSKVTNERGAYAFDIVFNPSGDTHHVDVVVSNFNSVISNAVVIDGTRQDVTVSNHQAHATFSGIDSLVNAGLAAGQAKELQTALLKFAPNATAITVDTSSISSSSYDPNNPSAPQLIYFSVGIDSKSYDARVDHSDLTAIELYLSNTKTGQGVYDSGVINSAD